MCRTPPLHEPPPQETTTPPSSITATNPGANHQNQLIKPSNLEILKNPQKISSSPCSAASHEDLLHRCSATKILNLLPCSPGTDAGTAFKRDSSKVASDYAAVSKEEPGDDIESGVQRSKLAMSDQILHCPTLAEVKKK